MQHEKVRDILIAIGQQVCEKVHHSLVHQSIEELSAVHEETAEDTIYQIDRDVESIILPALSRHAAELRGIILIAEGIGDQETVVLPEAMPAEATAIRILIDPIDGTRGIMYDKRSAFFLAGAAPNHGPQTSLLDTEVAVMVELPTSRSVLSDTFWAIKGQGAHGFTRNLETQVEKKRPITPTKSSTILGGFAQISRFFPPGKDILAQIEEKLIATLLPEPPENRAIIFEDQYISTGGQLYEMLVGHDRFVADLRASLYRRLKSEGHWIGLICHPYDVSAHLIGMEAGLTITAADGSPLNPPLDTTHPVDWIAYGNPTIRAQVEPVLQQLLRDYHLTTKE
ncbi:MAG: inositol monophosphatase family protein [bacterium]|jgi:fructose-1,6-bisphosphatase/inositol monophosphatase family enzyme|nr:inositol monophosphatase family protein [bacterium]